MSTMCHMLSITATFKCINTLLIGRFLQKLTPVVGDLFCN